MRSQDLGERKIKSHEIKRRLFKDRDFQAAESVMFYISLDYEVNTRGMIEEAIRSGKRVIVPYIGTDKKTITATQITNIKNLKKGPFGIYQPEKDSVKEIPLKEIDLIVVPAIAYGTDNVRLGRGKGYYDKFLASKELSSVHTIGLAFHFQIIDFLPTDPHDRPVDKVITD